jgi:NADPH:quinone reductase-like Zn-dependent oxidoreductase
MKICQLQDDWSIDNLTLTERPDPEPGPGEVLLRMKAASLNYRELIVLKRGYGSLTGTLPLIPVSDGVGEVVKVGKGVSRVTIGDRVCPMFMQNWIGGEATMDRLTATLGGPLDGVMAEYMVVSEQGVAKVPQHLTDEEAATLPCAALTAWSALVSEGHVKAGDRVLVQGTGGVSLFALQFAKLLGAHVIITSSSDEKLDRALDLGADDGINYKSTPEWGKVAKERSGGLGVDHIIEVGGTETLPQSLHAIRTGGTVSMIGVLTGQTMNVGIGLIVILHVRLQGITVGNRDSFDTMTSAISQHKMRPVVDRIFDFEQLREGLDYLASGAHFGKICIRH